MTHPCRDLACDAPAIAGKAWCPVHHALYVLPDSAMLMRRCLRDVDRITSAERIAARERPLARGFALRATGSIGPASTPKGTQP